MNEIFPHSVIAINDRPVCVWDQDLDRHNLSFCEDLDPKWFVETMSRHLEGFDDLEEVPQSEALALRYTYHHALETFFALLFALLQAPKCLPAWLDLYDLNDVRNLIGRVGRNESVLNAWGIPSIGWKELSRIVHPVKWESDHEKTIGLFADAWRRLGHEFLDENIRAEYNGLKHGFRARPGGGGIQVGIESEYGVSPPPEEMQWIGGSRHGSSSFTTHPIPDSTKQRRAVHVHLKTATVLWQARATVQKTELLVLSMQNVLAAAKVRNGADASEVPFHRFVDPNCFTDPWMQTVGVPLFEFAANGPGEGVVNFDKSQLLEVLRRISGLTSDS